MNTYSGFACFNLEQMVLGVETQFHVDHIKPATEIESDFLEVTYLFKAEFRMQGDSGVLFSVNSGDDDPVAKTAAANNQLLQQKLSNAATEVLVTNINRILNRVPVGRPLVIRRKRSSSDNLAVRCSHNYRMSFAVMTEPSPPTVARLWFFLIRASANAARIGCKCR
jgi:hypothetical protein